MIYRHQYVKTQGKIFTNQKVHFSLPIHALKYKLPSAYGHSNYEVKILIICKMLDIILKNSTTEPQGTWLILLKLVNIENSYRIW